MCWRCSLDVAAGFGSPPRPRRSRWRCRSSTAGSSCDACTSTLADSAPRITSHMITSEPSKPPSVRVFGDASSSASRSGSLSKRSRKRASHARVVEARALAVHLVRQPAGGDDRDLEVLRIALDRAAQRLAELVEAARATESGTAARPSAAARCAAGHSRLVRAEHRQRREAAVVERACPGRTTCRTRRPSATGRCARRAPGWPLDRRQVARAAAFVGDGPLSPTPSANAE